MVNFNPLSSPNAGAEIIIPLMKHIRNRNNLEKLFYYYDGDAILMNIGKSLDSMYNRDDFDLALTIFGVALGVKMKYNDDDLKNRRIFNILYYVTKLLDNMRFKDNYIRLQAHLILKSYVIHEIRKYNLETMIVIHEISPYIYERQYPGIGEYYNHNKKCFIFDMFEYRSIPDDMRGKINYKYKVSIETLYYIIEEIFKIHNIRLNRSDIMYVIELLDISDDLIII